MLILSMFLVDKVTFIVNKTTFLKYICTHLILTVSRNFIFLYINKLLLCYLSIFTVFPTFCLLICLSVYAFVSLFVMTPLLWTFCPWF